MKRLSYFLNSNKLLWLIIAIGIILRLIPYLFNRSLWLDESYLALNIVHRSFSELLQPLDYNQGAPIGFLMMEKVFIKVMGNNEYSLRFIPFLSGIIALLIYYKLVKENFKLKTVFISIGLFAISKSLIYYSSELKQYSSDVSIALLLFLLINSIQYKEISNRFIILIGLVGGISIWFSHPSIFVLMGGAVTLTYLDLREKRWGRIRRFTLAYLVWAISFVCLYFVALRSLSNNHILMSCWNDSFMPFPPFSHFEAKWYIDTFFKTFNDPVGFYLTGIGAMAFIVGCYSLIHEKKDMFYFIISSIIFTLLGSWLHKYPFTGRFILFLVPFLLIIIGEGARQIIDKTQNSYKIIWVVFLCLLFFHPLAYALSKSLKPSREEIRSVLDYVEKNQKDGDIVYLYFYTTFPVKYYSERYNVKDSNYIKGLEPTCDWTILVKDLSKLKGNKRVWVLLSNPQEDIGYDANKLSLCYLDKIGKKLSEFKTTGASGYLYDLSE